MGNLPIEATDSNSRIAAWPKLRIAATLNASSSLAQSLGVHPAPRVAFIDLASQDMAAIAASMGWSSILDGESELALESVSAAIEAAIEQAGMLSGYGYPNGVDLKEQAMRFDPEWGRSLSGEKPWSPARGGASLLWAARLSLDVGSERWRAAGSSKAGALLMCEHEQRAQVFVETLMDTFRRLGCMPVKAHSEGFNDWSQAASSLPPKRPALKNGFAFCMQLSSGEIVAANIGHKGSKALAASPLWKAYGQWHGLSLLGSVKTLKMAAGLGRSNRSYSACALPGLKMYPYPCQLVLARGDWRGSKGADANEAREALRTYFGEVIEALDVLSDEGERLGAMRPASLENWLEGVKANLQARDLERSLLKSRAKLPTDAHKGHKPRL